MTVKELTEKLSLFPPEMSVLVENSGGEYPPAGIEEVAVDPNYGVLVLDSSSHRCNKTAMINGKFRGCISAFGHKGDCSFVV